MTRVPALTTALLALGFAGSALAAGPQITVAPFTGPGAVDLRNQVVRAVCDTLDCVPQAKVKPKKNAPAVLNGRASKGKKGVTLEIWVVGTNGREKMHKPFAVSAGKLSDETLDKAAGAILNALGAKRAPPPPPPPEPAPTPVASNTPPAPPPEPEKKSDDLSDSGGNKGEPKPVGTGEVKDESSASASFSSDYKTPTILAGVSFDVLGRVFTLSNLTTGNLHEYRGPNLAPRLHLESYPLTRFTDSVANGLGLEANFSFTLGMKAVAGSVSYPSELMRFDVMAKFRYAFRSVLGLAVIPGIGFSRTSFSLSKGGAGSTLAGLPQVAYSGLKLGLGAELPLLQNKLLLGLGLYFVPVFGAGEIISPTYFQQGKVLGVDFNVGAGYRVIDNLEVRVAFQLEHYGLSFNSAAGDAYVASGASDLFVGGTLGLAYVF